METKQKKVFVAMSGGVDSSVAALLLKKQGCQVTGVYFILVKNQAAKVRKICQRLNIPFKIWDMRREFKKIIINDFISQYRIGSTPNPCVSCNRFIKFGLFYDKAKKAGADYIATGHYVRKAKICERYCLKKGIDNNKDQSYFLWDVKPKVIDNCLFPLGNLSKKQVKKLALQYDLPFIKRESQEICFITDKINNYLVKKIKAKQGLIKDIKYRNIVGQHQGLFFYTIGQRSGLGLPGGPWYVARKDKLKNVLWVTKESNNLLSREATVSKVNWLEKPRKFPITYDIKPRYRHQGAKAKIFKSGANLRVVFVKPQRALTSGQSAVFYKGDKLIGGGVIK